MRNAKLLKDTAQRERRDAEARHKEAEQAQAKANDYMKNGDAEKGLQESKAAQKSQEKAYQYEQAARDSQQEAANLEKKAIEKEREMQELQQSTQAEMDRLEAERRRLLGE
jgi:hypothetical protein